ncbi:MAG TPA: DsbA family protein [Steroidobacteraceae bacterium]|jgi:protein-disulfide isomerase|nr:DsbA family protein [Steroidobacteraceae bacterium]
MRWMTVLVAGLAALLASTAWAQTTDLVSLEGQKQMLANPGTDPVGSRTPDVTLVEYFDYNCPYCKKLVPTLKALLAQDARVALVYKDWPILGPMSKYAASSALAARWQGKYLVAHDALFAGPRLAQYDQIDSILQHAGIDLDALRKARTAHAGEIAALLKRNDEEAHALGLEGTPGIVIGRELVHGIGDLDYLQKLVAHARKGQ